MSLSGKQKITIGVGSGYAIAWLLDPLITIVRLNVEKWAEENQYDRLYQMASQPPGWLVSIWQAVTGNLALGLVLGALIVAFGEPVWRFVRSLFKLGPKSVMAEQTAFIREQRLMMKEKRAGQARFATGLYVGQMNVATSMLADEGWVEITARCFNATGHEIFLHRAAGAISIRESINGSGEKLGTLPPLALIDERTKSAQIQNFEEFLVVLEQRVPKEIAAKILAVSDTHHIHFRFKDLDILVCSHKDGKTTARLPLWDGVNLMRIDRPHSGRIIEARMEPITLRVSASVAPAPQSPPDTPAGKRP